MMGWYRLKGLSFFHFTPFVRMLGLVLFLPTLSGCASPPQMLPEQFMVSIPDLLKSIQWQMGTDNTVRDIDIRGVGLSVVASRSRRTVNIQSKLGGISQEVVEYTDANQAKQQYSLLSTFLFRNSFLGGTPQGLSFAFKDIEDLASLNLRADQSRVACMDLYSSDNPSKIIQKDCVGIFLYNNYLVVLRIWPIQNFSTYLSSDDLLTIYKAIDEKMFVVLAS